MFAFLLFLKLFVLTIKMGETPYDYDLMVEHQLSHKRNLLQKKEDSFAELRKVTSFAATLQQNQG